MSEPARSLLNRKLIVRSSELLLAGRKLIDFGQDVSSIEAALSRAGASLTQNSHHQQQPSSRQQYNRYPVAANNIIQPFTPLDTGSRLARGSAADLALLNKEASMVHDQRLESRPSLATRNGPPSLKRTRADSFSSFDEMANVQDARADPKGQTGGLMLPPPRPVQQPYVFMGRADIPYVSDSMSDSDHANDERPQFGYLTPRRRRVRPRNALTEANPSPLLGFPPVPPPTRPLPPLPPASQRNVRRVDGNGTPIAPVNWPPNRLALQALAPQPHLNNPYLSRNPAPEPHPNNPYLRQGGHSRAPSTGSADVPFYSNQTQEVSWNSSSETLVNLAPDALWNPPFDTVGSSDSRLGLSSNARISSSRQRYRESNTTLPDPHRQPREPLDLNGRNACPPTYHPAPEALLPPRNRRQISVEPGDVHRTNFIGTGSSPANGEVGPNSGTTGSGGPPHADSGRRRAQR